MKVSNYRNYKMESDFVTAPTFESALNSESWFLGQIE